MPLLLRPWTYPPARMLHSPMSLGLVDNVGQKYGSILRSGSLGCVPSTTANPCFIYETFRTLEREVTCFWTTKRGGVSALLFLTNKWICMMLFVMNLAESAY